MGVAGGSLFAVTLQLTVGCVVGVLLVFGVIIGVLLVVALNEKLHPVFTPFGVTVNLGGGFCCCFVDGGDQAHDRAFVGLMGG